MPTILVPLNLVIAAFAAGGLWVSGMTLVLRDGIAAIAIGSIVAYAAAVIWAVSEPGRRLRVGPVVEEPVTGRQRIRAGREALWSVGIAAALPAWGYAVFSHLYAVAFGAPRISAFCWIYGASVVPLSIVSLIVRRSERTAYAHLLLSVTAGVAAYFGFTSPLAMDSMRSVFLASAPVLFVTGFAGRMARPLNTVPTPRDEVSPRR